MRYQNPVIPGFYPDPSVCRAGRDFYLVNSSFEYFPGIPVWHSRDLVHWQQLGHALSRMSQVDLQGCACSDGIYAPTIRFHDGTFYVIAGLVNKGMRRNFWVTATDPAGPWSEPVFYDQNGIDPSLLFDDSGKVYFQSNRGLQFDMKRAIYQSEVDVSTGRRLTAPRLIWEGSGGSYVEGPHMYKKDGWYYLLTAEGGTAYGHMVAMARSRNVWGPYEGCPHNPILSNRHAYETLHGTGHADLVQAEDGSWWMVFLAFRRTVGDVHTIGRETCLAPVQWDGDGWPVVNGTGTVGNTVDCQFGLPVHRWPEAPERDHFDGDKLDPRWVYLRSPRTDSYDLKARPSVLRLWGTSETLFDVASPTFVGRRPQHLEFVATAAVEFDPQSPNEEAGLTLLMTNEHHYDFLIKQDGEQRKLLVQAHLELMHHTEISIPLMPGPVRLRITGRREHYAFSVAQGGEFREVARLNTRYLATEVTGGYTGVVIGLYATGNGRSCTSPADVDWFEYHPVA